MILVGFVLGAYFGLLVGMLLTLTIVRSVQRTSHQKALDEGYRVIWDPRLRVEDQ